MSRRRLSEARTRSISARPGYAAEALERRLLLSTIVWDGGPTGDGFTFTDPVNWVGDVLPGPADDAFVGPTGSSPTIGIDGNVSVLSIATSRNLSFSGGKISGATITASEGAQMTATGGILSDVTLAINLTVPNSILNIQQGLSLVGGATISAIAGELFVAISQSIDGDGSIVLDSTALSIWSNNTSTFTIEPGVSIQGRGTIRKADSATGVVSLINQGTILANVNERSLLLSGFDNVSNTGKLEATAGGMLRFETTSITPNGLGSFEANGGLVQLGLGAILNNAGNTLTLDGPQQTLKLSGGKISGGTITATGGALLVVGESQGHQFGTLSGVVLGSDVQVSNGNSLIVENDLFFQQNATIRLDATGSDTYVKFRPGAQTLGGDGNIVLGDASFRNQILVGDGGAASLTIGPNIKINGHGQIRSAYFGSLVENYGLIEANLAGQVLGITSATFTNHGSLVASNGARVALAGVRITVGGLGDIDAVDGTIEIGAESQLNNTGHTIALTEPDDRLSLTGGTILGGTITSANGGAIIVGGTSAFQGPLLNDVTLATDITIPDGKTLKIAGNLTLANGSTIAAHSTGNVTTLQTVGDVTIRGTGYLIFEGTGASKNVLHAGDSLGLLTIDQGVVLRGWATINGDRVVNLGTIEANGSIIRTDSLQGITNDGTLISSNGGAIRFRHNPTNLSDGTLNGGNWIVVGQNSYIYFESAARVVTNNANVTFSGASLGAWLWSGISTNEGTLTIGADLTTAGSLVNNGTITVGGGADLVISGNLDGTGTLIQQASGSTTTNRIRQSTVANDGSLVIRPNGTNQAASIIDALTVGSGGTVDLHDNDLILDYSGPSKAAAVQALINTARNGGLWDGSGITSTAARNEPNANTTLGVMESADYLELYGASATFAGESLDSTMVLVKYTYYAEVDFNGQVDYDDYIWIDHGFNNGLTGWRFGDADGNGQVDFDDYILIDLAFNTQSGVL